MAQEPDNKDPKAPPTFDDVLPKVSSRLGKIGAILALAAITIASLGAANHFVGLKPLKAEERATINQLIQQTSSAQKVDDKTVITNLTIHMNGTPLDQLTRADFDRAEEWLTNRAKK